MFDPFTIGLILTGVGTAIEAFSSIDEGESKNKAAQMNADMALQNAQFSRQQAAEEERKFRLVARKHMGSMRAGLAASGLTTEGSALEVLEESAATAELDALTIRHSGEMRAAGYGMEADRQRRLGSMAEENGYMGAGVSVLGGVNKIAKLTLGV